MNTKQNKQEIKNVTTLGAGALGSQIAWQIAWHGFNVVVYIGDTLRWERFVKKQ